MKHVTGNRLITITMSLVLTVATVVWLVTDESFEYRRTPIVMKIDSEVISSIDVEFDEQKIHLNVHLIQPSSCEDTINLLGINHFAIKTKEYEPICSHISNSLIRITYSEVVHI
jgi:hypothetical protein